MRAALYILSLVLLLPQLAVGALFLLVEDLARTKGLPGLLGRLLEMFLAALSWVGLLVLAVLLAWLAAGFFPTGRRVGAVFIVLAALGTGLLILIGSEVSADYWFFLPGVVAMGIAAWLVSEPRRLTSGSTDTR
jgi:hypothetical protein